jgi:hypothetical protein
MLKPNYLRFLVSRKITMPSQGGCFRDSDNLFKLRLDLRSIALVVLVQSLVCVMLVLLMTAGFAGRLQTGPPQSISPEFS